ncbi:efflux transporter outer membrane subunit [Candidatus Methylospira mobilis]|uniref:efflux transporter outer membrane subunit n=1 Tax=Candidatus Methylospira mobilis TaxID=1808979 RepID=UPI0018857BE0|nr:efflux transporter outer membrane subunit [Candidatus Methylospira mobilis]
MTRADISTPVRPIHLALLSAFSLALILFLPGCGLKGGVFDTVGPDYIAPSLEKQTEWALPADSATRVAHRGATSDLRRWWLQFQDPILIQLMDAAQSVNANTRLAKASVNQARASFIDANIISIPSLSAASRENTQGTSYDEVLDNLITPGTPGENGYESVYATAGGSLQSSWEIDLYGGMSRQLEASESQIQSKLAGWHDARVSVAVEVANSYAGYRFCELQRNIEAKDAASRKETVRMVDILVEAGFSSPRDASLSRATADEGIRNLEVRKAQCEQSLKSLVELTGLSDFDIRKILNSEPAREGRIPTPAPFQVGRIPAEVLMQRPDLIMAERNLAEASAKIGVERSQQYHRLTIIGNIMAGLANINISSFNAIGAAFHFGPSLTLPVFESVKREANTDAAIARYEAALAAFYARVRLAAKEVEGALIQLDAVDKQHPTASSAASHYRKYLDSMQEAYRKGIASLIEVETSRRYVLAADLALARLDHKKVTAWISLYRAVGGSWEAGHKRSIDDHGQPAVND